MADAQTEKWHEANAFVFNERKRNASAWAMLQVKAATSRAKLRALGPKGLLMSTDDVFAALRGGEGGDAGEDRPAQSSERPARAPGRPLLLGGMQGQPQPDTIDPQPMDVDHGSEEEKTEIVEPAIDWFAASRGSLERIEEASAAEDRVRNMAENIAGADEDRRKI